VTVDVSFAAMGDTSRTDAALVRRAKEGDVAAFESLFYTYQGRIYALCLRMQREPERAEDMTQETFVRAWQKLGSFRGKSAFFTWLYRLAVNTVLAELRSRGRWQERLVEGEDVLDRHAAPPRRDSPGAIDLERAIAELPPQARLIFILHDVEGYRHREIASMTGLAEGTSKAHLHRARQLLREALRS
jgi:RNA polymerase sigma-70 factor (ECF subfamily)